MGREDLKVSYYRLEDSARDLGMLKNEFDDIEERRDDSRRFWGHDGVRDAMDEFAGNMDYNRGKLSEKIDAMKQKVEGTLSAFVDADEQLASSFDSERPRG
ncbi:MAG: hypothetical protein ABWX74_16615 [Aeromicrobium sp.]